MRGCKMMLSRPRRLARTNGAGASVAWLPALLLAAGCGGSKPPEKFQGINRVSQNGSALYFQARDAYAEVRAKDPHGPPLQQAMDRVVILLDGAVTNDPKCP